MLEKKYNFKESEKKWQEFWRNNNIYAYDYNSTKETYSIDTPPPTISGSLHIGHIFSYTQAEMIARFQRTQGKNVFYPFGFDDNGLPTERLVEKEEKALAKSFKRSEFIAKCLKITEKYQNEFRQLWESLGFSVDWNLQYDTISPLAQRISQKSFLELARKGKAYIKESPVLWCTNCQTSIAQAELESTEKETTFNYLKFKSDEEELIVATTRPELLYGCTALFIHPEDERFNKFIGKEARVPLYNFNIPILGDQKVSIDKGSGIVMCATFGDTTDLEWYETHKLPYKKVITAEGYIDEKVLYIGGLSIEDARREIIEILKKQNLILKSEAISHTVAIHERCGHEIEIIPSKQWFIDVLSDRERFLKAADEINWYPASMKIRYKNWVENLKWDWCISRQRYFGVPFPVWYCKQCGKIMFAKEEELPINPMETQPSEACSCGSHEFAAEEAVLDTWATSSMSPLINGRWKEDSDITNRIFPMSMRTQAHEIIRTWAFYTIVKSIYHTGQIPWKDVMICGFVMAKKGEKISKSKNNSTSSPGALIEKYCADSIRYWAANSKLGTDTMFSEEELLNSNRFLTKLWNAAKFSLMHLQDYKGEAPKQLLSIDRYILEKLKKTENNARAYLDQYEIGSARHEIDDFFWKDFCDNYLEIVKDRLYKIEKHGSEARLSAQYALYKSLLGILKLYAPYVPHITEEIYQAYFAKLEGSLSIHTMLWDKEDELNEEILSFGNRVTEIAAGVRKYKSERNMSLKEPINHLEICLNKMEAVLLEEIKKDIMACTSANALDIFIAEEFSISIK